jgi:hypothetical protein
MSCVRTLALIALITAASPALANDSYTTRIDPRSSYGASVTIEEGVRVFRPLPPHKHVLINPDNRASVTLGINDFTGSRIPFGFIDKTKIDEK